MAFAKNERGVEYDENGNVKSVKLDKHLVPGDEGYGTHVPASATSDDPYAEGLRDYDVEKQTDDSDNVLVTDEEAREILEAKGEVVEGAHDKAVERRQENEAKAERSAKPSTPPRREPPKPSND